MRRAKYSSLRDVTASSASTEDLVSYPPIRPLKVRILNFLFLPYPSLVPLFHRIRSIVGNDLPFAMIGNREAKVEERVKLYTKPF